MVLRFEGVRRPPPVELRWEDVCACACGCDGAGGCEACCCGAAVGGAGFGLLIVVLIVGAWRYRDLVDRS